MAACSNQLIDLVCRKDENNRRRADQCLVGGGSGDGMAVMATPGRSWKTEEAGGGGEGERERKDVFTTPQPAEKRRHLQEDPEPARARQSSEATRAAKAVVDYGLPDIRRRIKVKSPHHVPFSVGDNGRTQWE